MGQELGRAGGEEIRPEVSRSLWLTMGDALLGRRVRDTDPALVARRQALTQGADEPEAQWHDTVPGMGQ